MEQYIGYYDKQTKEFHFSKEAKALSDLTEINKDLIKAAIDTPIDTPRYLIGPATFVKSARGGKK